MSGYRPHSFHWVPAACQRHASVDEHPPGASLYPDGITVTTLCGRLVQAENGEVAWLWDTCPDCCAAARILAGLPPVLGTAAATAGGAS